MGWRDLGNTGQVRHLGRKRKAHLLTRLNDVTDKTEWRYVNAEGYLVRLVCGCQRRFIRGEDFIHNATVYELTLNLDQGWRIVHWNSPRPFEIRLTMGAVKCPCGIVHWGSTPWERRYFKFWEIEMRREMLERDRRVKARRSNRR